MHRCLGALAIFALIITACGGQAPAASSATPAATATTAAATATAAPYKAGDKVTLIVPFKAGGGFDIYARTLQPYLEKALRQATGVEVSVLVQNVDGADGQLAVEQVYRAAPDGKTVVIAGIDIMASQQVLRDAKFDVSKMIALAQITDVPRGLVIRPGVLSDLSLGFRGLIDRSKTKPILWGGSGAEDTDKLLFTLLKENGSEIRTDTVQFQGTAEATTSLLRSEVEVYEVSLPSGVKMVQANPTLKLFVSFGAARAAFAKDTPTLVEQNIGGAATIAKTAGTSMRGWMAPPGMAAATAKLLEAAFKTAETDKDFVAQSEKLGNPVTYGDAATMRELLDANVKLYTEKKSLLK